MRYVTRCVVTPAICLALIGLATMTGGVWAKDKAPMPSPLGIYDGTGALVARVIDDTGAIVADQDAFFSVPVSVAAGQSAAIGLTLGIRYRLLFGSSDCTGQSYYRVAGIRPVSYLGNEQHAASVAARYLVDTRPSGIYLTLFADGVSILGLAVYSYLEYDPGGVLTCVGGATPGLGVTESAVETFQATSADIQVGGPGPYRVK